MSKKISASEKPKFHDGFYLHVDGMKHGPFLEKYRKEFSDLEHRKGCAFEPTRQKAGWITPPPKPVRTKVDKGSPLLEGCGFVAVAKKGGEW